MNFGFEKFTQMAGAIEPLELIGGNPGPFSTNDSVVFSSDDFRMYVFKIRRCTQGRSHDWADCPFAHPGEKARRRDPRNYNYSGTPCVQFGNGTCKKGDDCQFAHGVLECWLHPTRFKTQPCTDSLNCSRQDCFFAHTKEELRLLPPATVAAVIDLRDEAIEATRLAVGCHSKSVSPHQEIQSSSRLERPSFGIVSYPEPPLTSPYKQWFNALCIHHSSGTGQALEPTSLPADCPRENPATMGMFPEGSSAYTPSHTDQNIFRESLPLNQPHRVSFAQSEESFADYSCYFSSLPGNSSHSYHSHNEGMDELVHSLQPLNLQPRRSVPLEDRESIASNSLNIHLQNLNVETGADSRRSFEVPRHWKAVEDEYLRRMAISGKLESGFALAQQDPFSDGGSQQWSVADSEMNDFLFPEGLPGQPVTLPGFINPSGLALRKEGGDPVMKDPWGNPVSRDSPFK